MNSLNEYKKSPKLDEEINDFKKWKEAISSMDKETAEYRSLLLKGFDLAISSVKEAKK